MAQNNVKQRRLEGIIRKDISEIVQFELKDPAAAMTTITDVKVSKDHSYATVYVTFFDDSHRAAGLSALKRASGFIRSRLASQLDLRRCPEIQFKLDTSEEYGRHIDELIREIHAKEDAKNQSES